MGRHLAPKPHVGRLRLAGRFFGLGAWPVSLATTLKAATLGSVCGRSFGGFGRLGMYPSMSDDLLEGNWGHPTEAVQRDPPGSSIHVIEVLNCVGTVANGDAEPVNTPVLQGSA